MGRGGVAGRSLVLKPIPIDDGPNAVYVGTLDALRTPGVDLPFLINNLARPESEKTNEDWPVTSLKLVPDHKGVPYVLLNAHTAPALSALTEKDACERCRIQKVGCVHTLMAKALGDFRFPVQEFEFSYQHGGGVATFVLTQDSWEIFNVMAVREDDNLVLRGSVLDQLMFREVNEDLLCCRDGVPPKAGVGGCLHSTLVALTPKTSVWDSLAGAHESKTLALAPGYPSRAYHPIFPTLAIELRGVGSNDLHLHLLRVLGDGPLEEVTLASRKLPAKGTKLGRLVSVLATRLPITELTQLPTMPTKEQRADDGNDIPREHRAGKGWEGEVGGLVPVVGEGVLDGRPWDFRARGQRWSFAIESRVSTDKPTESNYSIDEGFHTYGAYGQPYEAGYMHLDHAWEILEACFAEVRRRTG